jgi:hypothetical protein
MVCQCGGTGKGIKSKVGGELDLSPSIVHILVWSMCFWMCNLSSDFQHIYYMTKMDTKFLLEVIRDVIINGNKHLGTFESPIIHFPIFNFKILNLMEKIHSKYSTMY